MRWVTWAAVLIVTCQVGTQALLAAKSPNEVPFELYRRYAIVVRGSIGDEKNLNFLIDTGAVPSVLDSRISNKLHLTGTVGSLSVFSGRVETQQVTVPPVRLGPFHSDSLAAVVRDLSFAEEILGVRIDALIGLDVLGKAAFTIDYQARKIVIGPIDASLIATPYSAGPGYAAIEIKIRQEKFLLLVDTGANDLVLFASATARCQDALKDVGRRTWSNIGGEVRVRRVQVQDVSFGHLSRALIDAFILDDTGESRPPGLHGLLGLRSLKADRVAFDPEHKLLAWDQAPR